MTPAPKPKQAPCMKCRKLIPYDPSRRICPHCKADNATKYIMEPVIAPVTWDRFVPDRI